MEGLAESGERAFEALTSADIRQRCLEDPLFAARYDGWQPLGWGLRSIVVRTHLRGVNTPLALKVLYDTLPSERRRFRAAAEAMMRVAHPCVLRTFAVFDRGPLLWVELELIEGLTLDAALARQAAAGTRWTMPETLEIAASLAEAVAAVHAAGFLHLDVKPRNVLVPRDPHWPPKLGDFGIARSLDATIDLAAPLCGSPAYLCPEAQAGQEPGPARDVYALAVTLYQVFSAGQYPFELEPRPTLWEMQESHRRRLPIPLSVYAPDLPDTVLEIVARGLWKVPGRRPTAATMAGVLRAAQGRGSVIADAPSGVNRLSLVLAALVGSVLTVCGLVALGVGWLLFG